MSRKAIVENNKFRTAVESTSQISKAFCKGLQGLGQHSVRIKLSDNSACEGSVDIDVSVREYYPQSNRWDYCFSYKGEVFFVEVHSAFTGEVSTVLRKLQWLKDWLNTEAPGINALKAKSKHPYYWLQSNGFHITKNSAQFRQAIQNQIKPIATLIFE